MEQFLLSNNFSDKLLDSFLRLRKIAVSKKLLFSRDKKFIEDILNEKQLYILSKNGVFCGGFAITSTDNKDIGYINTCLWRDDIYASYLVSYIEDISIKNFNQCYAILYKKNIFLKKLLLQKTSFKLLPYKYKSQLDIEIKDLEYNLDILYVTR